jgi:toxin FitB
VSGYLLDTNVASELRKRGRANPKVVAWFQSVEESDLFLSVLVLGEIRKGIEQVLLADPAQAQALERWLIGLERMYAERLLPVSAAVADRWGRLSALRPISTIDGLLAASALVHDLTLVTRHAPDVAHTGVKLLNPFQ